MPEATWLAIFRRFFHGKTSTEFATTSACNVRAQQRKISVGSARSADTLRRLSQLCGGSYLRQLRCLLRRRRPQHPPHNRDVIAPFTPRLGQRLDQRHFLLRYGHLAFGCRATPLALQVLVERASGEVFHLRASSPRSETDAMASHPLSVTAALEGCCWHAPRSSPRQPAAPAARRTQSRSRRRCWDGGRTSQIGSPS